MRFAKIKTDIVSGKEEAIPASWKRLLHALREEVDCIASHNPDIIPTIDFKDISNTAKAECFSRDLRKRGAGIIRGVIPQEEALGYKREAIEYLASNPQTRAFPAAAPQLYELYWSPPQIKARAHPRLLAAQRFAMNTWRPSRPGAPVTPDFPVTYADRLRMRAPGDASLSAAAHVDGGSVERWEPDGYGRAGTYAAVLGGAWEAYDPWDSSARLRVTSDLYNGAGSCSLFRMFQGWLALSRIAPGEGSLLVCPMLQLATAYFLLRPFFSPRQAPVMAGQGFLDEANWVLDRAQTSVLHGALPSYMQELNSVLHPHLQLDRSLVPIPAVEPGDYVIWHPDLIHKVDEVHRGQLDSSVMYIPACQTNALFLSRQRKAFLLGYPGPDFEGGKGESSHMGRPGVQEINDAGGEDALRAMGLMPWEEEEASSDSEREVLAVANAILFPDQFDMI